MKGLLTMIGTSAAGWAGWWLCAGTHLMVQYSVSIIAAGVGYYYTRKFVENLLGL
jgi:membrane protein implicated in regulation of membrane protease activity